MTLYSYHTLSAFVDEYKIKFKTNKKRMSLSFEVGRNGEMSIASFQFSFLNNNINHTFYTEILLGSEDSVVKEGLKRSSILFNIIRTWLEAQEIPLMSVRVGQKVNGVINYKQFYDRVEQTMNPVKQESQESFKVESSGIQ